ncbi:MAG: VOC family protein [SAR202 cluster bacterium]|jgi:catechol 2,3-dioxygenase-like lactoylglutathione lyase family enzyme|nr:VOC family protein [Dehalococcoidia bacterium]MQG47402.1 VOC family protein [SAR202 cluster bacterium]
MKLIRLEHMDLMVNDIEKSVEFYSKLGFFADGTNDKGKSVYMSTDNDQNPIGVELHQVSEGQKIGVDHVSFEVADVERSYHELSFRGIKFHVKPQEGTRSGRSIANFYDPDGLHLQISKKTRRADYEDWK